MDLLLLWSDGEVSLEYIERCIVARGIVSAFKVG